MEAVENKPRNDVGTKEKAVKKEVKEEKTKEPAPKKKKVSKSDECESENVRLLFPLPTV